MMSRFPRGEKYGSMLVTPWNYVLNGGKSLRVLSPNLSRKNSQIPIYSLENTTMPFSQTKIGEDYWRDLPNFPPLENGVLASILICSLQGFPSFLFLDRIAFSHNSPSDKRKRKREKSNFLAKLRWMEREFGGGDNMMTFKRKKSVSHMGTTFLNIY